MSDQLEAVWTKFQNIFSVHIKEGEKKHGKKCGETHTHVLNAVTNWIPQHQLL
jgi:hypothetical protein